MRIEEYFGTLQQSFVEIWKNHLLTDKHSDHKALEDYYEDILDAVDDLIEAWQGAHGKVKNLINTIDTNIDDPIEYLEELKEFAIEGREELIDDDETEIWSCVDDILTIIDSTLYKLKELGENKIGEHISNMLDCKDMQTIMETILETTY